MPEAYLILGSNIQPIENLQHALALLRERVDVITISTVWETEAVGSPGPNFLNTAVRIHTEMNCDALKWKILRNIETQLGRVRSTDKFAPRTIDMDIIIFDGEVIDPALWKVFFVSIPLAELLPDFVNSESGFKLHEIAKKLANQAFIVPRVELVEKIK